MDALELCAQIPEHSIDLLITDVPYGTTACSWDVVVPFADMWAAFKRVIKPRGAVVMTAAGMFAHQLACSNEAWFKYEWVWEKEKGTTMYNVPYQPAIAHEQVLVFSAAASTYSPSETMDYFPQMKTGKPYKAHGKRSGAMKFHTMPNHSGNDNDGTRFPTSVVYFNRERGKHPTQKPVALFEYLIRTYTQPGALILDPFAGSGTTAVAAKISGRAFICGDTSAEYCELARRRVHPEFGKAPKRKREAEPLESLPLFAGAGVVK